MTAPLPKRPDTLSDEKFLQYFENQTLDPVHFNHRGHLRIAWLYLSTYDLETAEQRVSSGIKRYAESLGATTKFHMTITISLTRIIAKRLMAEEYPDWSSFLQNNPDLVENAIDILRQHYSKELLFSENARRSHIPPDLKPL